MKGLSFGDGVIAVLATNLLVVYSGAMLCKRVFARKAPGAPLPARAQPIPAGQ